MTLKDLITSPGKRAQKLRKELYGVLAASPKNPSSLAQNLFAAAGGNNAAQYLYGKLSERREGYDFHETSIEDVEDFLICAHIMKLPRFAGRMEEMIEMGPTWEVLGDRWHQLSALASLERIGEDRNPSQFGEGDDEDLETAGITQASIDALLLTLETPVGGQAIARLIQEQHPAYSTDGWIVREVCDRIVTQDQMERSDFEYPMPIRLPSNCMGVVMCKFGVHPEFLVVKA